jgi:hypothetical protein
VVAGLKVSDPDSAESALPDVFGQIVIPTLEISLSAARGRLWLSTLDGISFGGDSGIGDGINDARMLFQGTVDAIDAAVGRLRYSCQVEDGCQPGIDSIALRVSDRGNSGLGGVLSARHTIAVHVTEW